MPIPDYQTIMLPLLHFAGDGKEHSIREAIDTLADTFSLTDDERKELLPSGQQAIFSNRTGWACTYLKKTGLLETTRRGFFRITNRGIGILEKKPSSIDNKFLEQFPEFIEFRNRGQEKTEIDEYIEAPQKTPEEIFEAEYQKLRYDLSQELLMQVQQCTPSFFEKLVIDLLVRMGYGGTLKDAGTAVGKSGDGGIDGIIKEDRLGLDIVYVQAKRWEGAVGRPEIQKFAGALQGQRARKGIFITTSSFTKEALDFVSRIDSKIVLIDGDMLSQLMMDYGLGVATRATYEIKRVDSDYFTNE